MPYTFLTSDRNLEPPCMTTRQEKALEDIENAKDKLEDIKSEHDDFLSFVENQKYIHKDYFTDILEAYNIAINNQQHVVNFYEDKARGVE